MRPHSRRNYGIDLLRSLSMLFVVVLHQLSRSGGLASSRPDVSSSYWTLEVIAFGAVNMFAIISGFVGYREDDRPLKISGMLQIWLQALSYNVAITLGIHLVRPDLASRSDILKAFFPVCSNSYWYLNAYLGLVAISPLLNLAIAKVSREKMKKILLFIFITFSLTSFSSANFGLGGGYSVIWLILLYIIGAAMKKFDFNKEIPSANIFGFGILMPLIFTIMFATIPDLNYDFNPVFIFNRGRIVNYLSPTILISSASAVLLFSRFQLGSRIQKLLKFCTPSVFAVYLINTQPLIFEHLLDWQGLYINSWKLASLLLSSLLFCVGFFIMAILIDKVRAFIFKIVRIDKFLKQLDSKLAQTI